MPKSQLNQKLTNMATCLIGTVDKVNDDGTYSVNIKGRPGNLNYVEKFDGTEYNVGDDVTLERVQGDTQLIQITGYSSYQGSGQPS